MKCRQFDDGDDGANADGSCNGHEHGDSGTSVARLNFLA
jgi:hypothetical protein